MAMLISSVEEITFFVRIHRTFNFESFAPALREGTAKLKEYITPEIYLVLLGKYEAETVNDVGEELWADLLLLSQKYLCYYALHHAFLSIRNHVSELGVQQTFDDSGHSSRPTPVGEAKSLLMEYQRNMYAAVDGILLFLERNQQETIFNAWLNSESYTENYALFIRNCKQFSEYVSLVKSRQTFLALRNSLRNAEVFDLKLLLCKPLFEDLKAYLKDKDKGLDLSVYPVEYEYILILIYPLLCNSAMFRGLAVLSVVVEGDGLYLGEYSILEGTRLTVNERAVETLREQFRADMDNSRVDLKHYLDSNIGNLPKYRDSPCVANSELRQKRGSFVHEGCVGGSVMVTKKR